MVNYWRVARELLVVEKYTKPKYKICVTSKILVLYILYSAKLVN